MRNCIYGMPHCSRNGARVVEDGPPDVVGGGVLLVQYPQQLLHALLVLVCAWRYNGSVLSPAFPLVLLCGLLGC